MVYYSLRCGNVNSALKCLENAGPGHEDLITALSERIKNPVQKISSKLDLQLKMQY
jgi:nuclear pore complex protein Nup93